MAAGTLRIISAWRARSQPGMDGFLLLGPNGTLLLCLAAIIVSFFVSGYFNPYWRRADMDLVVVYQALLLNDGRAQSYFDHPGYLSFVLIELWFRLLHWLGVLQ